MLSMSGNFRKYTGIPFFGVPPTDRGNNYAIFILYDLFIKFYYAYSANIQLRAYGMLGCLIMLTPMPHCHCPIRNIDQN